MAQSPLHEAAAKNDCKALKELLAAKPDLEDRSSGTRTPLLEAGAQGASDALEVLLGAGADPNAKEEGSGFSALHFACKTKDPLAVISLIDFGADPSAFAEGEGVTVLDCAEAPNVQHALLTSLINRMEFNKSVSKEKDASAALLIAAALGDVERAKSLLGESKSASKAEAVADIMTVDALGRNVLHWAAYKMMMPASDVLMARGADAEARASTQVDKLWTPGLWDSRCRMPVEEGKEERGELKNLEDGGSLGPTPYDVIPRQHPARVYAKAIIDIALGKRTEEDFVGNAAKALAAESRAAKEYERLRNEGATEPDKALDDVLEKQKANESEANDGTVTTAMSNLSIQTGTPKRLLGCALRMAASHGMEVEVKELIDKVKEYAADSEAGVDASEKYNEAQPGTLMTPLHFAAHFGNIPAATMLVEVGASKSLKDGYGRTPMQTCPEGSRVVEVLQ